MRRAEEKALEIATQIAVARASNSTATVSKESGENFAAFFEAIYSKVVEIAQNTSED